jgi:3-deoxy-7-phosphoheptulonate synthase
MDEVAARVREAGATMLRGGAYKPRTSPYAFQGLGVEGLEILRAAGDAAGLPVVTEVLDVRDTETVATYADVLQVGARNMQNFMMLEEMGKVDKPVLLKRGLSATIEEMLSAAEYILKGGNRNVMLCERGIRTFETYTRNTLDLSAVAALRSLTHLPVIVDPSHATGRRSLVGPMCRAAIVSGAHGLMVEVHPDPEHARCDGPQSLTPDGFAELMQGLGPLLDLDGRRLGLQ